MTSQKDLSTAIRVLAMDAVEQAKSGHPGMPMGMADVATVLFTQFLKYDAADPHWPDRDRFVLSAGHGSMLLYALLYLTGVADITIDDIKNFRQLGSKTAGHPEWGHLAGVETTTGPLGQGLATAVGMALAERIMNARFGDDAVDHMTWVIAGDGCLMEGVSHEAISLAGHLALNKLVVLWDDNGISIDGPVTLSETGDQAKRFEAAGWAVRRINGQDPAEIADALAWAKTNDKPTMIACKTTIGFGAPNKAGKESAHGAPLGKDEVAGVRKFFGWEYPPFEIPEPILSSWREYGRRGAAAHASWTQRLGAMPAELRTEFDRRLAGTLPEDFETRVLAAKRKLTDEPLNVASRKSSEWVIDNVLAQMVEVIGGSADLTHSNFTKAKTQAPIVPGDYSGHYVHYGIREFGMCAAMNGLALHGGVIPYGGTFLVFSDYARPAIRLAALMGVRVMYVFTHDSIGLGEDGPTHQPVEHMAALRAIPNLDVFRPADAIETLEAWQLGFESTRTPSLFALSRQNLPTLRTTFTEENLTARGAYELQPAEGEAKVTLFATGSEVMIAAAAKATLDAEGIPTRLVSVPCFEMFDKQSAEYQAEVIGTAPVKIAVEAAIKMGWERFIGPAGIFIGMHSFGASGPIDKLYPHFGITAEAIVAAAKKAL